MALGVSGVWGSGVGIHGKIHIWVCKEIWPNNQNTIFWPKSNWPKSNWPKSSTTQKNMHWMWSRRERATENSGSDTDSVEWIFDDNGSVASGEEEPESFEEPFGVGEFRGIPARVGDVLRLLGCVDLNVVFQRRTNVNKSVPHFLKIPFRNAIWC